ncbi:MAG: LysM peptidoglycan-binding domain-containing protein [Gammaproteobacteria bacterium]|nr:LysM peptidoglycan-binding domain-containing protein [Gammaproteobacteria bacterium]
MNRSGLVIILIVLCCSCSLAYATRPDALPHPSELKHDISFWTRVFTEIDTKHGFIHDNQYLNIVYQTVKIPERISRRARDQRINKIKEGYRKALLALAEGKRKRLTPLEKKVLKLWSTRISNKTFKAAAHRLRFQLGQADKFKAGWQRAGAWRAYIEQRLVKHGVPKELAALPHVESSFNPKAYSHVGAAGLWQFTRYTGQRFMRIDHVVDERLDPFKSSDAAARLLKYNYDLLDSWPLAITAYNHGAAGMRRAARKLGTRDIATILRRYKSRTFGFASRNFYPAFLAAVAVDNNAQKYFGPLRPVPKNKTKNIKLSSFFEAKTLATALNIDRGTLKSLNPALRPSVWNGQKRVPKDYELRIVCERNCSSISHQIDKIAAVDRHHKQTPDRFHKVRRGDTLSKIASRYRVSSKNLAELNSLRNRHRIRVGQVLRLPIHESSSKVRLATTGSSPSPTNGTTEPSRITTYNVRRGDNITKISQRFGLQERQLLALNNVRNKNRIFAGQTLKVAADIDAMTGVEQRTNESQKIDSNARQYMKLATLADAQTTAVKSIKPNSSADAASLEPEDEQDTEPLGPALPSELHPALSADPSDYTVAKNGTVEVQAAETLGHFADWLDIRTQKIRNINRFRFGRPVLVGKRLKLDFSKTSAEAFEQRRTDYHCALQSGFFKDYQITDTHTHIIRRGESLWHLTHSKYRVPVWLVRQYNPDLDLYDVHPGMKVIIPRLIRRQEASVSNPSMTVQRTCDSQKTASRKPAIIGAIFS